MDTRPIIQQGQFRDICLYTIIPMPKNAYNQKLASKVGSVHLHVTQSVGI